MSELEITKPLYEAAEANVKAERRFRRVLTAALLLLIIFVAAQLYGLRNQIDAKVDALNESSARRSAARTQEQRTIAKEQNRYITCILLVTVEERKSAFVQQRCFDTADLPGGLTKDDFSPFIFDDTITMPEQLTGDSGSGSNASPNLDSSRVVSDSNSNTSFPQVNTVDNQPESESLQPEQPEQQPGLISRLLNLIF